MSKQFPDQRWQIFSPQPQKAAQLVQATGLSPLLAQVLINRGIETSQQAAVYIDPESEELPSPLEEFPDLAKSITLLKTAIAQQEKIAICGDYDADGMTSTALLLRVLRQLGADVDYAIPSRMKDGYGINKRIVEAFAEAGVGLILTVDNGIAAYEAIAWAVELGLSVIITDHHEPPEKLPPADAILNPKLVPESSPYRGLAGVGVAYILAVTTAQELAGLKGLTAQLMELFTLGTIADLAPLVGVNRRWLKRGLRLLPKSQIPGVQALMQVAGVQDTQQAIKPDDIGFRLGPRINAIGRISDPQIVIELLTTSEPGLALERAMQCEQSNRQRQQLCEEIENEAIALLEQDRQDWEQQRVIVLVQPHWHHGVIGIVASRLVDRYGFPVFLCTYEDKAGKHIRGSARGIPEFHVFEALEFCHDLLGKFGGHKAAGGFSLSAQNFSAFQDRLSAFAHQCLEPEHLKPLVEIDGQADFAQLDAGFYQQIDGLNPWGIENNEPVFWTPNVRVIDQRVVGSNHLKLMLQHEGKQMSAIAWRRAEYFPLPQWVDIAYKLRENTWNGHTQIELEVVGFRLPVAPPSQHKSTPQAQFNHQGRTYRCRLANSETELRIKNDQGKVLSVNQGQRKGILTSNSQTFKEIDVTKPPYYQIIKAALAALKQVSKKPRGN